LTILEAFLKLQEENLDWQDYAVCKYTDPDAFFPETMYEAKEAIEICERCPVQEQCFQMALDNEETQGVWGGIDFTIRNNKGEKRVNEAIRLRRQGLSPKAVDAEIRSRSSKNRWGQPDR